MATLTTIEGKEIKTFQELKSILHGDGNSFSRDSETLMGDVLLDGEFAFIYKHWSYEGNFTIYKHSDTRLELGEIEFDGDWFPYLDEHGNVINDGIYDLNDRNIKVVLK